MLVAADCSVARRLSSTSTFSLKARSCCFKASMSVSRFASVMPSAAREVTASCAPRIVASQILFSFIIIFSFYAASDFFGQQFMLLFGFAPPGFWSALNFLRFVQPHALGLFNLRHLRIVNHDLHHAEPQRTHLLPDDFQPVRLLIPTAARFDCDRAHILKILITTISVVF